MQCDKIRNHISRFVGEQTVYLFITGSGYLFNVLRKFDLRNVFAVLFGRNKFVNAAENRFGLRGYKSFADAERVYLRTLKKNVSDDIFVKRVGNKDSAVFKSRFVKHLSDFLCQISYVARVYSDTFKSLTERF